MGQFETAKAVKVNLMDLDKVHPNTANPYDMENIEELADNIKQFGLMQNVDGYSKDESSDEVSLLSGHRRLKALQLLVERGDKYTYSGADITGKIPVAKQEYIKNANFRILSMIAANHHRDMADDEKNRIIETTDELMQNLENKGKWKKPGDRRAHVIASITGIAEHYIKEYFASKNRSDALIDSENGEDLDKAEKDRKFDEVHEQIKRFKQLKKTLLKAVEQTNEVDSGFLFGLEQDEVEDLDKLLKELSTNVAKLRSELLGKF
jgi:hypothetical protein